MPNGSYQSISPLSWQSPAANDDLVELCYQWATALLPMFTKEIYRKQSAIDDFMQAMSQVQASGSGGNFPIEMASDLLDKWPINSPASAIDITFGMYQEDAVNPFTDNPIYIYI